MYDKTLLKEKLEQIMDALQRINRRFAGIETPLDFLATDVNHDKLDAISMLLISETPISITQCREIGKLNNPAQRRV
jgi:hypothetical protein